MTQEEPAQEPLLEWQRELLDERIAEDDRDPEGTLPGDELLAWLRTPLQSPAKQ